MIISRPRLLTIENILEVVNEVRLDILELVLLGIADSWLSFSSHSRLSLYLEYLSIQEVRLQKFFPRHMILKL